MMNADTGTMSTRVPQRRPRILRWLLAGALAFLMLALLVGGLIAFALAEAAQDGFNVVVNGQPWDAADWVDGHTLGGLALAALAVLGAVGVVVLTVAFVVPLSLLAALLSVGLGLGLALLAVLAVGALLLSPLWLAVLLLWLVLRRRPVPRAAA